MGKKTRVQGFALALGYAAFASFLVARAPRAAAFGWGSTPLRKPSQALPAPGTSPQQVPGAAAKNPPAPVKAAPKIDIKRQMLMDTFAAQKGLFCKSKDVLKCFKKGAKECLTMADGEFKKCKAEIADKSPAHFSNLQQSKMFTMAFMGCYGGKMKDAISARQAKKLCK